MEAELRAARERAVVPLEARMTQFKDMLLERGVNQCSSLNFLNDSTNNNNKRVDNLFEQRPYKHRTLGQVKFSLNLTHAVCELKEHLN